MDEEDDIEIRSNSSEDEQFQEATNKRRKIRGPLSIIQEDNSAADDIGIKNHLDEKVEDSFQHNQVRKVKRFVEVDDICPVPEELMEKSDEEEMNELLEYDAVPKKKTSIVIDLTNTADSDDE